MNVEIPEAFVLIAIPSWIAIDDPLWARLVMLAAATVFLITTSLLIFNDHAWFNPEESDPPAWHEILRLVAGPITALPVCLIALPAASIDDFIQVAAEGRIWAREPLVRRVF